MFVQATIVMEVELVEVAAVEVVCFDEALTFLEHISSEAYCSLAADKSS